MPENLGKPGAGKLGDTLEGESAKVVSAETLRGVKRSHGARPPKFGEFGV